MQMYYMKVDHRSYGDATFAVAKRKPEKWNPGLYGIRTLDVCDTGAALLPIELTNQPGAVLWINLL